MRRAASTSRSSSAAGCWREERAQATVEAALLLPSFLIVLLLALQPVCLLYTRAVMESAAAETARLMATGSAEGEDAYCSFALRRLAAVPDVAIFHAGGPLAWEIGLEPAADADGTARVEISGAVSPLPVLGAFAGAVGPLNGRGDVELRVTAAYAAEPSWLEGSYETWIASWD